MSAPQIPPLLPPLFTLLQQPWQGPAAYWQTVASIMNSRGQTLDILTQHNLQLGQQLSRCRSWADCVGAWASWQASCFTTCTNLALTTHQQRQALWQTWQLLATRQTPAACFSAWSPTVVPAPAAPVAQPLKATQPQNAPALVPAAPAQPGPTQAVQPAPSQVAPVSAPQPKVVAPMSVAELNPSPTPAAHPLPFPTISRTGDAGVVRSGTGATIAAAAATRRSVVARRTQRKSRLARAR
jgi:hypothetical protein